MTDGRSDRDESPPPAYSVSELMACIFARQIRDWDVGGVPGLRAEVPLAAVGLAKRLYAPNLVVYTPVGELNGAIQLTGTSMDHAQTLNAMSSPSLDDVFDMNHRGDRGWIFYGGMQVDAYANINLVCIGDDWHLPTLRGPGAAGGDSHNFVGKIFIWLNRHDTKVFVPRVDFVSTVGFGPRSRQELGLTGHGPDLIVTPICCLKFNVKQGQMELVSVHPGVSTAEVLDSTGFDLLLPSRVPVSDPPTEEELATLRRDVDPLGLLRVNASHG